VTMPTGFPGGGSPGAPGVPGGGGGPITSDGTPNGNATAIIQAAAQRGFTPEQTQAILATGLDESGLNQGAVSPNGLWKGVFQQDSGYPNRDDAAGNIQGFFDRLGPPSGDTWEKIFALQQGTPYGAPNARNAYMGEIKSKLPEAQSLYAQLANSANTAPGGGGGSAPAPGGGDGSYAGVAATDNASTSDPRHGGIPGAPSGEGQDLLAYMKQVMDGFNAQTGAHLSVMADYPGGPKGHPDDGADHSVRRALDIAGTSQEMDAFAAMIANNPALRDITRQLIHNPQNDGGPFTADMNVIGGREVNGWQVYGSGPEGMPGHADHDHWALQDLPGGGGSGPGVTNAGYTVGGQPGIVDVDKVTPDPNAPDPAAPGVPNVGADPLPGGPPTTPPPVPNPSALQAPAGAPNAVQTPYGTFEHTPAMTPDQQALLSPEQKYKFDEWLDKYVSSLETATDTQDTINRDQERVDKALKRKNDADAAVLPGDDETAAAAQQADQEYVDAQADLAKSKRHQTDETNRQATAAEKPASDSKDKPDQNAEDFGRGFLGGVASDLGFGNVFGGKTPDKWGIVQLLGHLGGFGMGLLEGGDKSTGGDTSTPSAGSGSVAQGGLIGIVESIFPGLKDILGKANNGTPPAPPTDAAPGGAPANIPSSSGAVQPAGRQGDDTGGPSTTTNQNLQVNNTYQGFNPSPQTKDQIRTVSNYTSAAQMSGGGGILL
jgi:hypothetical protein